MENRGEQRAEPKLLAIGRPAAPGKNKREQQRDKAEPVHGATIREREDSVAASPAPLRAAFYRRIFGTACEVMAMPESGPRRIGLNVEVKPHAYDPALQPELFEGVLARRVVAFLIDVLIITVPLIFVAIFIFMFGLVTLGLGWFLFFFYGPIAVIWALVYYGMTFGSPASATIGMRMVDLEMRTWYGTPCYFVLGAVHAIAFWLSVSFLTPFILLVPLLNDRRRLLHDMLVGTIVINNPARASALRNARGPL